MTTPMATIRLSEQRWITQAFINEDPTTIELLPSRGESVETSTGGHKYAPPVARAPQVFRLSARGIDSASGGATYSSNDQGKVFKYMYDLIGLFNAQIEEGDNWDEVAPDGSNMHYHVDALEPSNGYEVCAVVTGYATEPQHGDA